MGPEAPIRRLPPGEILVVREPTVIVTILGSCVAVTMLDRSLGVGAMCHGLLPGSPAASGPAPDPYRYVSDAIRHLADEFSKVGAMSKNVEVKVFGGADVLGLPHRAVLGPTTVGEQNVRAAFEALERAGLKVAAFDVRGPLGRKIFFHTGTGEVLLERLNKTLRGER